MLVQLYAWKMQRKLLCKMFHKLLPLLLKMETIKFPKILM